MAAPGPRVRRRAPHLAEGGLAQGRRLHHAGRRARPPEAPGGPAYTDARFLGVHASFDKWDDTELDLYWLFLHDEETAAGGNEARSTIGARFVQQNGSLEFGTEVAAQFGEENGADVDLGDVYALHAHLTWFFDGATSPYARVEANYATGNDPNTPENERFKNLFPTAHGLWGYMDFMFWENVLHGTVEFGLKPDENSKLSIAFHTFESVEETDRFVGPQGKVAPTGAAAGTSNDIGNEVDLFYNVEFDTKPARTWLQIGYGIFLPGSGAKAVAGNDTAHFLYVMSGVTF